MAGDIDDWLVRRADARIGAMQGRGLHLPELLHVLAQIEMTVLIAWGATALASGRIGSLAVFAVVMFTGGRDLRARIDSYGAAASRGWDDATLKDYAGMAVARRRRELPARAVAMVFGGACVLLDLSRWLLSGGFSPASTIVTMTFAAEAARRYAETSTPVTPLGCEPAAA